MFLSAIIEERDFWISLSTRQQRVSDRASVQIETQLAVLIAARFTVFSPEQFEHPLVGSRLMKKMQIFFKYRSLIVSRSKEAR